jgi:hypothetical protein
MRELVETEDNEKLLCMHILLHFLYFCFPCQYIQNFMSFWPASFNFTKVVLVLIYDFL